MEGIAAIFVYFSHLVDVVCACFVQPVSALSSKGYRKLTKVACKKINHDTTNCIFMMTILRCGNDWLEGLTLLSSDLLTEAQHHAGQRVVVTGLLLLSIFIPSLHSHIRIGTGPGGSLHSHIGIGTWLGCSSGWSCLSTAWFSLTLDEERTNRKYLLSRRTRKQPPIKNNVRLVRSFSCYNFEHGQTKRNFIVYYHIPVDTCMCNLIEL